MTFINASILMPAMSAFDHSDLDGRLLQLLLAVVEERSVTRAAERLGVTQSAVSHLLDKLRAIVGDPLVVKAGRGIVPTARAEALAVRARVLLEDLRGFATPEAFDPRTLQATFTIAANDLQCDLLLPPLLRRLRAQAPGVALRVIPSGVPTADMLRSDACQLVISPRPPDAGDLLQRRLFADRYRVFFDARCAPRRTTLDDVPGRRARDRGP
jgi:DNA-binding transcriptional LysR family regulator